MKVKDYFLELYHRLFILLFTFGLNFVILFYYKEQLIYLIGQHQQSLIPSFISTSLAEIFLVFLKLSFFLAFYFSYPVILAQVAFFIIPGLYKYEYKIVRNFFVISILLYLIATIFTTKVFLPYCWAFFSSFQLQASENLINLQLEPRIADYLNFFFETFLLLNLVLHLFLVFIFFLRKVTLDFIVKYRKVFYLGFFIFATLVTPPDVGSQLLVGSFFICFFEIFLFSLFVTKEYQKGE